MALFLIGTEVLKSRTLRVMVVRNILAELIDRRAFVRWYDLVYSLA